MLLKILLFLIIALYSLCLVFNLSLVRIVKWFKKSFIKIKNKIMMEQQDKPKSLKKQVADKIKPKEQKFIFAEYKQMKSLLILTHKENLYKKAVMFGTTFAIVGLFIGLIFQNVYLAIVLVCGGFYLPTWIVRIKAMDYEKYVSNELLTALSMITSTYITSNSINRAVNENIRFMNIIIRKPFEDFITETKVSTNTINAIRNLSNKFDNEIFKEWCSELILCQSNSSLNSNLLLIIRRLSKIKAVQSTLDLKQSQKIGEMITMIVIVLTQLPFVYLVSRESFAIFTTTWYGKIGLAYIIGACILAVTKLLTILKPIRYRR